MNGIVLCLAVIGASRSTRDNALVTGSYFTDNADIKH